MFLFDLDHLIGLKNDITFSTEKKSPVHIFDLF